jgi:hypothetical protein
LFAIIAMLAFPAPAAAEWLPDALPLAVGGELGSPEVVTDSNGRSTVAWQDRNGEADVYRARRVEADGTLGPVFDISDASAGDADELSLDVAPNGEVVAVWTQGLTLATEQIRLRRIGSDGSLGPVQVVSAVDADSPLVEIGASGDGYVVWRRDDGGDTEVEGRATLAGGSLGTARSFTSGLMTNASSPRVAVNPSGQALVIWRQAVEEGVLRASRVLLGGVPEASFPLAGGEHQISSTAVAARPDGGYLVLFSFGIGAPDFEQKVQRRTVPEAGAAAPVGDVSPLADAAVGTVVAVDAGGVATAVWRHRQVNTEPLHLEARRILPGGEVGPPLPPISSGEGSINEELTVGVDAAGNATVLWAWENPLFEVLTRRILADGTLQPPSEQLLAAASADNPREAFQPALGVAPGGAALAALTRSGGGQPDAQVHGFRFLPPPEPSAVEPSNRFRLGKLKRNRRRGTAVIFVHVPGPGRLVLAKNAKVRGATKRAKRAGKVVLRIRPRGKARRKLLRLARRGKVGKVRVRIRVTFTPDGGSPATKARKVRLLKSR